MKKLFFAAVVLAGGALAAHPKDDVVELQRRADAAFAAHRAETDREKKNALLEESAVYLEKIVFSDGNRDEALRVDAADCAAERFRNLGQSARALAILEHALSAPPQIHPDGRIRLLLFRASLEEAQGLSLRAEKTYREMLSLDARDMSLVARARNRVALILTDVKGRHEEALKALVYRTEDPLTEAKLPPTVIAEREYAAGQALRGLGRIGEAKSMYRKSVDLFKSGNLAARAEFAFARACHEAGDEKGAEESLERVLVLSPGFKSQVEHFRKGMAVK